MSNYNLKKQLRKFSAVSPSPTWLAARRNVLINQIEAQVAERELTSFKHKVRLFIWSLEAAISGLFTGIAARGTAIGALFLVLVLGSSGYVLAAANDSVPGDSLYQVKLAVEDARLNLARSPKSRVALEVEFASRRLEEVKQLSESNSDGVTHATILVAQFQDELTKVSAKTNELSQSSPQDGAEVALLLDAKLNDYKHTLAATNVTDPAFKKQVNAAISNVARAETQNLKVIVDSSDSPEQAVVEKISNKIASAEESLRQVDEKLVDEKLLDGAGTKSVREQSAIAKVNLAEARQKVNEGDYKAAVGIIDQIEDIVYEVEAAVDESGDKAVNPEDSNETADSASNIIE